MSAPGRSQAVSRPLTGMLQALRFDALKARVAGLWPRDASEGGAVPVRDWIHVTSGSPTRVLAFDQALLCVVVALLALGVVMVYSASIAMSDNPRFSFYTPTYFLSRHVLSFPCHQELEEDELAWICATVRAAAQA